MFDKDELFTLDVKIAGQTCVDHYGRAEDALVDDSLDGLLVRILTASSIESRANGNRDQRFLERSFLTLDGSAARGRRCDLRRSVCLHSDVPQGNDP